jgi:O-antigen ligase
MAFWGTVANMALEHPILGSGGAGYRLGKKGGTRFNLGSVHNVLLSSLIVSGVPGLIIFLMLIWATYRRMNVIPGDTEPIISLGKILWCSFTMLILVAITNDVTGARILYMFFLMGLIANLSLVESRQDAPAPEVEESKPGDILYAKRGRVLRRRVSAHSEVSDSARTPEGKAE